MFGGTLGFGPFVFLEFHVFIFPWILSAHGQRVPEWGRFWLHPGIPEERHNIMDSCAHSSCGVIPICLLQRQPDAVQSLWGEDQSLQPPRRRAFQSDCCGPLCRGRWMCFTTRPNEPSPVLIRLNIYSYCSCYYYHCTHKLLGFCNTKFKLRIYLYQMMISFWQQTILNTEFPANQHWIYSFFVEFLVKHLKQTSTCC